MRLLRRVEAGAAGGLVAAVTVAAFFFVQGAINLHPLSVAVALASGLLGGASRDPGATSQMISFVVVPLEIIAYTVVHVLVFAVVGATAALVVNVSPFWQGLAGAVAYTCVVCTGLLYLARWFVGAPTALDVLGLPRVLLANALAGVVIAAALYLGKQSDRRGLTV